MVQWGDGMQRSYWGWYVLAAIVALVPVGLRVLTWQQAQTQEVDESMAQAGQVLFLHEWTPGDPLANGGDGLGPVFNAKSCVACHHQGGAGGSGGLDENITAYSITSVTADAPPREGVVHKHATDPKAQETLAKVDASLPATANPSLSQLVAQAGQSNHCLQFPSNVHISQRNTPALFGAKLIDEIPDRDIIANERSEKLKAAMAPSDVENLPVGRAVRLADGRVGRFGWKAQTATLAEFVQAACANELGLSNPDHPQPTPLGQPVYPSPALDLTLEQCAQLTAFIDSLARPVERLPEDSAGREKAEAGKKLFLTTGCADCHTPDLGSVEGIYSDLLLHRMGRELVGGGSYGQRPLQLPAFKSGDGPQPDEWRTPPLWGVADSAPYLHDGRAATLEGAIRLHGGQGAHAAQRFAALSKDEQDELVAFLKTLRAP
jgi:CxxC motif-containing protein (DUF1111 family)